MNKTELINEIATKAEMTKKDTDSFVNAFMDVVTKSLMNGEKVTLSGFGTFDITQRKEREGRNPQTGEALTIPASKTPKFKAGKILKNAVNGIEE